MVRREEGSNRLIQESHTLSWVSNTLMTPYRDSCIQMILKSARAIVAKAVMPNSYCWGKIGI
jgi:hypothetical protein